MSVLWHSINLTLVVFIAAAPLTCPKIKAKWKIYQGRTVWETPCFNAFFLVTWLFGGSAHYSLTCLIEDSSTWDWFENVEGVLKVGRCINPKHF
jgi:hypothetical protein